MFLFAGCHKSTALNLLHRSIRSTVEVNIVGVCDFDTCRGSPELQQVRLLVQSSLNVLYSVYVPILLYYCTRIEYVALAIFLSDSGKQMHRDKVSPQRMHAASRIVTRGSCCTKRFAELNGNCERYCSLQQLVASLCAADEGSSVSVRYNPKAESYTRIYLYRPPGLLCCGGCTWNRISRQPITAITWHFSQQTLFEPLTVTGASASCFGERYRDVLLSQNLDENNSNT